MSTTSDSVGLVAVGHDDGLVTVWDLSKHLMLWKTCSLRVDVNSVTYALSTLLEGGASSVSKKEHGKEDQQKMSNGEVKEDQKEKTPEKKELEDKEQLHRTQEEDQGKELDSHQLQQQQQQPQEEEGENETQQQKQEEDEQQEKEHQHKEHDTEEQDTEQSSMQEDKEQTPEDKQHTGEDKKETQEEQNSLKEEKAQEKQQQHEQAASQHQEGEEGKVLKEEDKSEGSAQTNGVTDKPSVTPSKNSSAVVSCKLHSLSIVHSAEKDSSKETSKSASNKDTSSNTAQESSLLAGVSFSRECGKQDAAIIVYAVPSMYNGEGAANSAAKSKQKSSQPLPANSIDGMADLLLDWDEVPPLPMSLNVDLDTPSWQLAPPNIPVAPPPPPVKGGMPAKKSTSARHLQTFLISENIDNLPDDASPVVSTLQPCGHNQFAAAIEYGPTHGGCVILFNLNNFFNQTIIGESLIYEYKTPDEHAVSMCAMEKADTDSSGSSYYVVTVNKSGSLAVYSDDTGHLKQTVVHTASDPFVSCFCCTNVGLLGVVTKAGSIRTVRVINGRLVSGEPNGVGGDGVKDSGSSLNPLQG